MYKSIRYHIRNLTPGKSLQVNAGEVKGGVLRNYASAASADFIGRKYTVHFDREERTYTVTRLA